MPDFVRARRHFLLAVLGTGAALLTGCGQGEYDQRMSAASQTIAGRAADAASKRLEGSFHSIMDPSGGTTGIKFRRPAAFVPPSGRAVAAGDPNAKIAQADIPGFCYALQTTLADNNNQQVPAYCYVFAAPKASSPIEPVKELIKQGLANSAPNLNWTTGNVGGLPLHSATASGTLDFEVNGAPQPMTGTILFSIVEGPEKFVMIAFRYEDASAAKASLPAAISDSIQSISSDVPAPAPPQPANPMGPAGS